MTLESALLKQILSHADFQTWNGLKQHYFPEGEYRKLWKIVDKHVHKYHDLPSFEDLKLEVRSRELQEKVYAIETVETDVPAYILLDYLKNQFTQSEILERVEDFVENQVAISDARENIDLLQEIVVQVEDRVETAEDNESMESIELFDSEEDLQKLVHWIDAGAPKGLAVSDPLAALEFPDRRDWQLGEPDYVITAPRHEIPATGVLDYINVDVPLPFEEDKWVKAVQYIAGDESVLHHLLTYVTAPAEVAQGEAATVNTATRFLEGYAPGKVDAMTFPENTGVYIPEGYKLSMQFHYTTNGRATSDETVLGLYTYDEPPTYENFTQSVSGMFRIPPYTQDHEASARYVFNEDVVVTGLRAHMHFRGKDMKFSAEYPDGTMVDLLSVPNYSYAWQPTYALEEPMHLPVGTRVHVTGAFDNSEHNPANPDPSKELTFGLQSWDEMFIGYWTYHSAEPAN